MSVLGNPLFFSIAATIIADSVRLVKGRCGEGVRSGRGRRGTPPLQRCNALRLWNQAILKRDSVKQTVEYRVDQVRCTFVAE